MKMLRELKPFFLIVAYLLCVQALCLLFSALCRIVMLTANCPANGIDWALAMRAMLIGVKFDNLIVCYIASLPVLILPVFSLASMHRSDYAQRMSQILSVTRWYYSILYSVVIFIGIADVRYYHFFENHLNIGVTEWFGFVGETAGMLFGDSVNWCYLGISLVLIAAYIVSLGYITMFYAKALQRNE